MKHTPNDGSFTGVGNRIMNHLENLEHENKHLKRSNDWLALAVILQTILVVLLIIYFTV